VSHQARPRHRAVQPRLAQQVNGTVRKYSSRRLYRAMTALNSALVIKAVASNICTRP